MDNKKIGEILKNYKITAAEIRPMTTGVGGDTYLVNCEDQAFVLKISDQNAMNRPEAEPKVCDFLREKGLPVSRFLRTVDGMLSGVMEDGRIYHLQEKINGANFSMNHAPAFLMKEMPQLLGKLQSALMDYEPLPEGISENFFRFMTPENAKKSYENSLHVVEQMRKEKNNGSKEASDEILLKVISDLEFRCALMDRITPLFPDFQRLTVRNTHGDFTVNQILCSNSVVTGIIDFTTACRHPVVWELTRSFFTAEPSCQNGELDTDKFREYISLYEKYLPLSAYDKELLLPVYVYQLAVCDYYSQYLSAAGRKAEEFLEQAAFATKVLRKSEERKDYIKC